jgi:MoaA/NifB/PqqE/SkfB family radical SAM enzyme
MKDGIVPVGEIVRRAVGKWSGQLRSLPILALSVHSACNCRCVMCDIWKANADKREISLDELERHMEAIRRLHVQRVMLTGGEPLLHRNLWAFCDRLRREGIRVTMVTTGLLVEPHADAIARTVDDLVVSIDGPPPLHDEIRRIPHAFDRIAAGIRKVTATRADRPVIIVRSVVQQLNHRSLAETTRAVHELSVDRLSFLAADVSSTAFNRPEPWDAVRRSEVALSEEQLNGLERSIREVESTCSELLQRGFLVGGMPSLWRIYDYFRALLGRGTFPPVRCNAPWTSAVLEPENRLRPCFFHPSYPSTGDSSLDAVLNSAEAIAFRRALDVTTDATCQRCVCSLSLPVWARA